ncbi:MAG TPA: transcriptional regulator [Anaerolineaceae bacterium]|jgi:DeoR/GlpR family transcriptional regulator of sugar metabolism|nr:transcriptional regulator [Anaerolineaceae bacterium]
MTTYERRQSLLDILRKHTGLGVQELATALDVSEGTVRNDLNALELQGLLTRVHGGAVLHQQEQFQNNTFIKRYQQNAAAKLAIAREAAALVSDDASILLDASSTAYYFAQALSKHQRLRVMTNGFEAARALSQNTTNTVILIGGIVNNGSSSVTGLLSEHIIEEMHVQKAFLSCSGFSLEHGMTEVHLAEAQLKRKVIESSQELFALVDSSKFGKEDLTSFARTERISRLFTDQHLSSDWPERLRQAGIEFTICEEDAAPVK